MNFDVVRIKRLVVAIYTLLLLLAYWLFSDFDDPIAPWRRYVQVSWAILGFIAIVGLFWNREWGRWLAVIFYSMIVIRFLIIVFSLILGGQIFDKVSIELVFMILLLCFPLALLFEWRSKQRRHFRGQYTGIQD